MSNSNNIVLKKEDLKKNRSSLGIYLIRCLEWLFLSFPEITKIAVNKDSINSFSASKQRNDGIAGIKTILFIKDNNRRSRSNFANKVLASLDNGPLFVVSKNKEKNTPPEFIWHGSKDHIEKDGGITDLSSIDYGKKVVDALKSSGSSAASRYPITYYRFNGSIDELKKILKKVKSFDNKVFLKEALGKDSTHIEAKCIVDFTVKGDKEGTNKESEIDDAGKLLTLLKIPLKVRSITQFNKPYELIESIKDREGILKRIRSEIETSNSNISSLDKSIYIVLFNSIMHDQKGISFTMKKMKESRISNDMTFIEALQTQKTYGAVISELFIPFLLLCGFKTIDGKEILKGLPKNEEVVSVEFPVKKNNVLTDYNTTFANTSDGKKYAISAKWTDGHNSPGLFALLYDNIQMFGNKVIDEFLKKAGKENPFSVAANIVKTEKGKEMPKKLMKLATSNRVVNDKFINKLAACVEYKDIQKSNEYALGDKYSEDDRDKLHKKFEEEIGHLYKKTSELAERFPYTIPVVCDKKLAEVLNQNTDFLLALYQFMFGYYGSDVEFQQIQLNPDLSLKYIEKTPEVTKKNVAEYIAIESSSSIKRNFDFNGKELYFKAINITQPLKVKLLK